MLELEFRRPCDSGVLRTGLQLNWLSSPPLEKTSAAEDRPSENECSVALRLRFGAFTWYTGGDLTGIPDPGMAAWRDLETPIGRAIGPADARVMNQSRFDQS